MAEEQTFLVTVISGKRRERKATLKKELPRLMGTEMTVGLILLSPFCTCHGKTILVESN
jgi:hypothetical protein